MHIDKCTVFSWINIEACYQFNIVFNLSTYSFFYEYYMTISLLPLSGYISPEYAFDGVCSTKSDVFSFGVLVLEIISGKRTTGFYPYGGKLYNLISYVSRSYSITACYMLLEHCLLNKSTPFSNRLGNFGKLENGANSCVVV